MFFSPRCHADGFGVGGDAPANWLRRTWVEGKKGRVAALLRRGEGMDVSAPGPVEAEGYFSRQKYLPAGLSSSRSGVRFPAFCSFPLMGASVDSP